MPSENRVIKWSHLIIAISSILVVVAIAWATTQVKLDEACKDVGELEVNKLEKDVFEMHSTQQAIDVKEIKDTISTQRREQRDDMKEIKDLIKAK